MYILIINIIKFRASLGVSKSLLVQTCSTSCVSVT